MFLKKRFQLATRVGEERLINEIDRRRCALDIEKNSANLRFVDLLRGTARRLDVGLPALAVAWVISRSGVTGGICGARHPDHVDGWLPAKDITLTGATLAEIEDLIRRAGI